MTEHEQTRRNVLKTTAAVGAAVGLGGLGSAQLAARQDDQEVAETFELVGVASGWVGASGDIDGEQNPTLNLEAGKKYRIVWENGDGKSHNVAIFGTDKNLLVHSPIMANQGQTQTVEFIATEAMVDYYCEVHYIAMRGDVKVSGQADVETQPAEGGYFEQGQTVGLDTVATGLNWPTAMGTVGEGENERMFVADQTGEIWEFTDDDGLADEPLIDVSDRLYHEKPLHPETGMLGVVFHPDFQESRRFYTRESRPVEQFSEDAFPKPREKYHHMSVVTEYEANEDLTDAQPTENKFVLTMPSPASNHNSGDIDFGPDGLLYVAIGDGGFGGDTGDMFGHVSGGNAQDVENNLLGSILRIDVDEQAEVRGEQKNYAIPDDNPLVGENGLDEHWAWGFRNPWGMSFDSEGRLFAGDVGRSLQEEVDLVVKGGNYGWRLREGTLCFDPYAQGNPPKVCANQSFDGEPLLDPLITYPHSVQAEEQGQTIPVGQSVIGGHIYEGDALSDLQGKYVFGEWSYSPVVGSGRLLVATGPEDALQDPPKAQEPSRSGEDVSPWTAKELQIKGIEGTPNFFVSSFGNRADNELYVLTSATFRRNAEDGAVHRIVPPEQHDITEEATEAGTEGQPETTQTGTTTATGDEATGNETEEGQVAGNQTAGNETTQTG